MKDPVMKSPFEMNEGDVFLSEGKEFVFKKINQGSKSFIGKLKSDETKGYRFRMSSMFRTKKFEVIGKVKIKKIQTDIELLRKGDLFVIKASKCAELFRFKEFTRSGKIKAINPLTNDSFTIARDFTVKLVSNL